MTGDTKLNNGISVEEKIIKVLHDMKIDGYIPTESTGKSIDDGIYEIKIVLEKTKHSGSKTSG